MSYNNQNSWDPKTNSILLISLDGRLEIVKTHAVDVVVRAKDLGEPTNDESRVSNAWITIDVLNQCS